MTWHPADDELDALARTLPVPDRASDRIEQERTSVLAQAAGLAQLPRVSRIPLIAGAAMAFAAAAAILIWVIVRPSAGPKEQITALGPAHFERIGAWPDFVVRVDDGRVAVRVSKLGEHERFRAVTTDAEVEVRGTRFEVAADHGHITTVDVSEGRVELRWQHEQPVFLAAGQTWSPPRVVERDAIAPTQAPPVMPAEPAADAPATPAVAAAVAKPATPVPTPAPVPSSKRSAAASTTTIATVRAPATDTAPARIAETKTSARAATTASPPTATTAPAPPAAVDHPATAASPSPGEAEFRAGVASLRAGDATAATHSFASACQAAQHEALGEDACFWLGAAAKRAGDTTTARDALTRFLGAFPSSSRAGEASALLGWILYDAGELDAAEKRFELAANDRVAKVKESAQRGLEAIARKRSSR